MAFKETCSKEWAEYRQIKKSVTVPLAKGGWYGFKDEYDPEDHREVIRACLWKKCGMEYGKDYSLSALDSAEGNYIVEIHDSSKADEVYQALKHAYKGVGFACFDNMSSADDYGGRPGGSDMTKSIDDPEEQDLRERFAGHLNGFYQQDDVINAGDSAARLVSYLESHDGNPELIQALNEFIKANWDIQGKIHEAYHIFHDEVFNPHDPNEEY